MKFAICNETLADRPFQQACEIIADCGYTGIELAPFSLGDSGQPIADVAELSALRRDQLRGQMLATGLEVVGLHWLFAQTSGMHLTSPDESVRRRTAKYLVELARLCHDLGGSILVLGSPAQRQVLPGVSPQAAGDFAAETIRQAMGALEEYELVLAVEPLGPAEGNFLNTADEAVQLIERVGSPCCRLHLDCKAMSSEAISIPDLIARHRQVLAHFHANDPNRQGPGFGDLDFLPILEALGKIDYRGWVSVEVFDLSPGAETLTRASLDYLLTTLAECSAS